MPMEQITLEMVKPLQVVELAMEVWEPVEVVMAVAAEDSRTKPARSQPHQGRPRAGTSRQALRPGHSPPGAGGRQPGTHASSHRPEASGRHRRRRPSQPPRGHPPWQPFSFRPQPLGRLP